MKTVVLDLIVVLVLAAPSAALISYAYSGSLQTAGEDQPQPPTRETWQRIGKTAPIATNVVIDSKGMPLLVPAPAG